MKIKLFFKCFIIIGVCVVMLLSHSLFADKSTSSNHKNTNNEAFHPDFLQVNRKEENRVQDSLEVHGKVSSLKTNQPLQGVKVILKGTSIVTITDVKGNYTLKAPLDGILIFRQSDFIDKEIQVNSSSIIDVVLTPLSESIVTGYGTQKKANVTGALESIKASKIVEVTAASDVSSSLKGRISGVQIIPNSSHPGAAPLMRVRGDRTLDSEESGRNNPLIVLDGIPFMGTLTDINPNDIASFNVLKDASATAIYGSRGANGVILITMKKGQPKKTKLSYTGYSGITSSLGKYDVMNGEEFARLKYLSDAVFTPDESISLDQERSTDWQELMYKEGYVHNHNINFSGGNENTLYSVGAGYFRETSVLPGQGFTRYSLRASLGHKFSDFLEVGISSTNALTYQKGGSVNPMFDILTLSPLYNAYNANGKINEFPAEGSLAPSRVNPLTLYREEAWVEKRRRFRSFNTAFFEIHTPLEGLSYKLNAGLSYRKDKYGSFFDALTPMQNDINNSASVEDGDTKRYTLENLVFYNRTFGNHNIDFIGLFSTEEEKHNRIRIDAMDIESDVNQFYDFLLATKTLGLRRTTQYDWRLLSLMARMNYNFNERYMISFTVRRDGSSHLNDVRKWFTYPAIAIGWNIHNESFLNTSLFSNMRLRTGFGKTSNKAISELFLLRNFNDPLEEGNLNWALAKSYNVGLDFGILTNRITGSVDYYYNITDNLLQDRTLSSPEVPGTVFNKNIGKTKNKGIEVTLNTLAIQPQTDNGFRWEVDLNFTTWTEEITQLYDTLQRDVNNGWFVGEPIDVVYDYKNIGIWQSDEEEAAEEFEGGTEPGDIKVADLNGNGVRDEGDRTVLGHLNPDFMGGITNRFSYKGFDLTVILFGRVGGMLVSRLHQANIQYPIATLEGNRNQVAVDYWTQDNPTNAYPRPGDQAPNFGSTLGYFDGTFMRVRSINIGYSLPDSFLSKVGINTARVSIIAYNPFKAFFSDYVDAGGINPEPNNRGGTNTPGFGNRYNVSPDTPVTRSIMLGLNLSL